MNVNRIAIKLGVTIILLFLLVLLPLGFVINQIFSGFYYNQVQTISINWLRDMQVRSLLAEVP